MAVRVLTSASRMAQETVNDSSEVIFGDNNRYQDPKSCSCEKITTLISKKLRDSLF